MFADRILPFALAPADLGCRNQILGAFRAINELTGEAPRLEDSFVFPNILHLCCFYDNVLKYHCIQFFHEFQP